MTTPQRIIKLEFKMSHVDAAKLFHSIIAYETPYWRLTRHLQVDPTGCVLAWVYMCGPNNQCYKKHFLE